MRKVILTGSALLLMVAASYAQSNKTTLNQTGNRNNADVEQTGNAHKSTVTQDGNSPTGSPEQRAVVDQKNTNNESVINQRTGSSTSGANYSNLAITDQISGNNKAFVNQLDGSFSNRAGITQQSGGGNVATVDQGQNSGGAGERGNGTTPGGNGNWAGILQEGSGNINTKIIQSNVSKQNFAEIKQYGQNNGTEQNGTQLQGEVLEPAQTLIEQSNNSTNNYATINQGTSSANTNKNSATIRQVQSSDSKATVNQLSSDNYANIRQLGTFNNSTVTQDGGMNNQVESQALGNRNQETLTQTGANNQIYIRFQPQSSNLLSQAVNDDNTINMTQTGNNNRSVADLRSSASDITVNQMGNDNYSRYQVRGDANSTTGEVGLNNDATVTQNRNITGGGTSGNFFNGEVRGDQNNTNVTQTGEGNRFGTSNFTVQGLLIDGDGNQVTAVQTGRKNVVNMQILGTGSNDGNIVHINQNSPTSPNNAGNRVGTLNDTNENDERGLEISGNGNNVKIGQDGVGNSVNMSIGAGAVGANGNVVDIAQTGNNNKVGSGGGTTGRGLFITGNGNNANIKQDGGDETQAKQNGNDELTVRQQQGINSTGNSVLIEQGGTGVGKQIADIEQNGSSNKVEGLGGSGTFAQQNGAGINTADITQTGVSTMGNVMQFNQTGMGNMVMSTQSNN